MAVLHRDVDAAVVSISWGHNKNSLFDPLSTYLNLTSEIDSLHPVCATWLTHTADAVERCVRTLQTRFIVKQGPIFSFSYRKS